MTDKQPMQASDDAAKAQDPVAGAPGKKGGEGESQGGAYPNPHTGKDPDGFDGGQSGRSYSGGPNPNATTED
ncbi:MAG: hypothetical protein EOP59_00450 [Sphingomonadales bacterium]|nr:MAG: hypothetical protein EOP59_00450 [Sphingomonadales bacterium]